MNTAPGTTYESRVIIYLFIVNYPYIFFKFPAKTPVI